MVKGTNATPFLAPGRERGKAQPGRRVLSSMLCLLQAAGEGFIIKDRQARLFRLLAGKSDKISVIKVILALYCRDCMLE